jgi:hypothetical protein
MTHFRALPWFPVNPGKVVFGYKPSEFYSWSAQATNPDPSL